MDKLNKGIILIPYAEVSSKNTGENISNNSNRKDIYLKNCCVALVTAKKYNPNSDVALVTNIEIPKIYQDILEKNGVLIFKEDFDRFVFDDKYTWGLAFYKLCALSKIIEKYDYEYYSYLDSDVCFQNSFDNIWKECEHNILMYDINHGLQVNDYNLILQEFNSFLGSNLLITHYGGEFFAANKENTALFLKHCEEIYYKMIENNFKTTKGDEFIISIAAHNIRNKIKNAGAYIFRFWTGSFYLVSTCYKFNPITVLHVPAEKNRGMIKLFDRYILKNRVPSKEVVWKTCSLIKPKIKYRLANLYYKIRGKKWN